MTSLKKNWTVKELLTWMTGKFQVEGFSSPLLDAQLLMCCALKYHNRVQLYVDSENIVKEKDLAILRTLVKRRLTHEPVAYILNQKYWYDLDLYIDKNVLIPRPETETLLDFVIETAQQKNINPKVIFDFGTGSGCLAIALAKQFPNANVIAVDISAEALQIAIKNAKRNDVQNIEFIEADLNQRSIFEQLKENFGPADIVIANPPYVTENEWHELSKEVKDFEPKLALVSQNNGAAVAKSIFEFVNEFLLLKESALFAMELAHQQAQYILDESHLCEVLPINAQAHEKPSQKWFILKDLENKERFLVKIYEQIMKSTNNTQIKNSTELMPFCMPAEWAPHAATWACFPFGHEQWYEKLDEVRQEYSEFIKLIAEFELVHLFVNSADNSYDVAQKYFENHSNIKIHTVEMNDAWFRDNGPIFIQTQQGTLLPLKWNFNAWGEKYAYEKDKHVAYETFHLLNCQYLDVDMIFEGGGIDVNGAGLALSTRQCLLNKNRNKLLTQTDIEHYLKQYLGINECIWLNQGLEGDHTDGHIDTIARFINQNTILCSYTDDHEDKNYQTMEENLKILSNASQKHNLSVIKLPLPKNKMFVEGVRLPCTYANFYMSHDFVIMPTYDDPNDQVAFDVLKSAFPKHKVFGLSSKYIILGGGSFHCLTQQQPKGVLL